MAEMKKITITVDDVKNAEDYIPVAQKEVMARLIADLCVEQHTHKDEDVPTMMRENRMRRQQFLMGVFSSCYLKKEYELEELHYKNDKGKIIGQKCNFFMTVADYDMWAGSHVINQLERMKRSQKEVSDKIYDMLYDFKLFENMLYGAIKDELERRNDPCKRVSEMLRYAVSSEALETMKQEISEAKAAIAGAVTDGK